MKAKIARTTRLARAAIERGDLRVAKKHLKTLKRLGDACRLAAYYAGSAGASVERCYETGNFTTIIAG
jgi:hypothetical protein